MIIKAFKQFFIPHKHNDYKPHFFREISILSIIVVAVVLLSISAGTTVYVRNTNMTATVLPAVLVDLTNNARLSNNEQTLTRNPVLDNAAKLKAENMASLGYFAHTSPTGITPWYWFDKAGYSFTYAGENLAINFSESADVQTAWLNSPTHKANILSSNFTEIGIATMDGIYQGRPTTYVVQMFGKPTHNDSVKEDTAPVVKVQPKVAAEIPKPKVPSPKPFTPAVVVVTPSAVKGDSSITENNLEVITDTEEFIAVRNTDSKENVEAASAHRTPRYSSWYQKFMFMAPTYTNHIYQIFIWIVITGLLIMIGFEISRKHKKNIVYGILLFVIMICLIYINRTMFVTSLFT